MKVVDTIRALLIVGLALCLLGASCPLLSPSAKDLSTAKGDATHTENRTAVDAGRDSIVNNWTLGTGWALVPLTAVGWFVSHRGRTKEARGLQLVIDAIEQKDCKDCKRRIAGRCSPHVNKRVAKLTGKPR